MSNNIVNSNWLEQRQKVLTATDCLFVLKEFNEKLTSRLDGVNTWNRTRFQLYMEKSLSSEQYIDYQEQYKKLYPQKAKIMQEGKDREAEIAEFARADLGFELEPNGENVIFLDEYKIGATPDYYAELVDPVLLYDAATNKPQGIEVTGDYEVVNLGKGILECKLTGEFNDDKKFQYEFQVQQQLLCTGLKWACIAIGIKEEKEIDSPIIKRHYHFIKANEKFQQAIIEGSNNFWKWFNDIKSGNEKLPEWDRHNERDAILFNIVREDIEKLAEEYLEAQEAWKHWEYVKDILKGRMQTILGNSTNSLEIEQDSGQKIKINQIYTKETFYTDKDKESAIKKAESSLEKAKEIEIGSIKTAPKLYRFNVEII